MDGRILLVDDDATVLAILARDLAEEGYESLTAGTGSAALEAIAREDPDAVILDLLLPDTTGQEVLRAIRRTRPDLPVVILSAQEDASPVVECLRLGALDYLEKPYDRARLVAVLRNARDRRLLHSRVRSLATELRRGEGFDSIVGGSPAVKRLVASLRRAADTEVTVLLEGESGTGKEVAARAIHAEGQRRTGPFVGVNCGALPEGLVESQLFGHEKGSFTGAAGVHRGFFEQADGGTLFLDEVGELPPDQQVRLLRVLQERVVQRVGGAKALPVDVRVVAATNRDLKAEAAAGRFREDLYYRLAVFPVRLPPLRERGDDVPLLAEAFLRRFADRHRRPIAGITAEAMRVLRAHAWPGNVRELENVIERAAILEDGDRLSLASLPDDLVASHGLELPTTELPPGSRPGVYVKVDPAKAEGPGPVPSMTGSFYAPAMLERLERGEEEILPMEEEERRILLRALERTGWNFQEAAARLGIGRATIYRKIEKYGLRRARPAE
ncbi:MAG: sigma-54-dependent Fis family transcriptional regulator [Planctomycetaceae bacterium]|nr:sigma-54 dependent transcriptional regulator [Planctomycetota bacterium]NUN51247.1 sigma-54-dependent Fis family transcriptional regulator [Planctomycetaceae bacterium]